MSSEPYRVVEVRPDWALNAEPMGTKAKFWYRNPATPGRFLFKHPRPNSGEHWAEKIAAEVARVIGVQHAPVDLAVYQGSRGSVTKDFTDGHKALCHGNELLKVAIDDYNPDKTYRQSSHTLDNALAVMDLALGSSRQRKAHAVLASYLVLDALVGNTDRHHENWGVLVWLAPDRAGLRVTVAPSFDHASSLGRELTDTRRAQLLSENRVSSYLSKGRGAMYWSSDDRHAPSPMELVRRATVARREVFAQAVEDIASVSTDSWQHIVGRVPTSWMTSTARRFATAVLECNHNQLRGLLS